MFSEHVTDLWQSTTLPIEQCASSVPLFSAESFFKTLKQEDVYLKQYQTFEEAQINIGQFIEDVYNTK